MTLPWTPARAALAALCLALGLVANACAPERERPPDLLLVVLDTLRVDQTSLEGGPAATPFLEAFAAAGTRYPDAHATSCWTLPAHASMFTGELPDTHGADQDRARVRDDLPLVAERLRDAGYQTAGFTRNPWISRRSGLERGFEHLGELWPRGGPEVFVNGKHPVVAEVERWLARERDPERPLFLFVNLIQPHAPYTPAERWARRHFEDDDAWRAAMQRWSTGPRALVDRVYGQGAALDEAQWGEVRALYAAELEQTDAIAGRLFELLDGACDPARSVALVVSDHGENLGDLGQADHVFQLNEALTRVLCLARGPGFGAGAVDGRAVQLQDVQATLLSAAGVAGAGAAARDLLAPAEPRRVLVTRIAWPRTWLANFPEELHGAPQLAPYLRELWAAQEGSTKLVVAGDGDERVFDLAGDGGERAPVDPASVEPELLERLRAAVAASRARGELLEAGADAELDPAELEALRALGYVR